MSANLKILFYRSQDTVSVGLSGLSGIMSTLCLHVLLSVPSLKDLDSIYIENSAD